MERREGKRAQRGSGSMKESMRLFFLTSFFKFSFFFLARQQPLGWAVTSMVNFTGLIGTIAKKGRMLVFKVGRITSPFVPLVA